MTCQITSVMETISISSLKAHLSSELKKVQNGMRITVLDHKRPVAELIPTEKEELFLSVAEKIYSYMAFTLLTAVDPMDDLEEEQVYGSLLFYLQELFYHFLLDNPFIIF